MCNWQMKASEAQNRLRGRDMRTAFPQEFYQNLPPETVQMGQCLYCGKPFDHQRDMYPPGKTPRYMCETCYNRIVNSGLKQYCLTCGKPLPAHRMSSQNQNPRELRYAMHSGLCEDYHALLAGIVLGVVPAQAPMLPRHAAKPMIPFNLSSDHRRILEDVIDVEPVNPRRQVKFLKLLE